MKRNQVVLIYGLPASGKYTVAKKIQEQLGGVLLDNHYFYDLFTDKIEVPNEKWSEYSGYVANIRNAFLDTLRKYYPKKHHTRYIFTSVILRGEKFPTRLRKFAHDTNADFIPIELKVDTDVLLDRCDTEQRRQRKKISNKGKYQQQLTRWVPNAFHSNHPNKLVLDSSRLTLDETFAQVKKHLKKFG